jgi:chorismate mutase / prephenate dehydratase
MSPKDSRIPGQQEFESVASLNAELATLRRKIEDIDESIIDLINKRVSAAVQIGKNKMTNGVKIFSPEREEEIFRRLYSVNNGRLPQKGLYSIFFEIISLCRSLQKPLSVAFLGPEGTFSHVACVRRFGKSTDYRPQVSIMDVFEEVENDRADLGLVPAENSLEGGVGATMDRFMISNLSISGEIYAAIRHCLISGEDSFHAIETVYSHPQALNQCRNWLRANLPGAGLVEVSSTSAAAGIAAEKKGTAAVCGKLAAEISGVEILAENIQDNSDNTTRFFVIGKQLTACTGLDKTSIVMTVRHEAGSLFKALNHFADRSINLTRIESRPVKHRPWEYAFFVDCEGHRQDAPLKQCLESLSNDAELLKILGSYPKSDPGTPLE